MNWDAVGAIAELLGAVGVIVSLVYLAVQIRQNTTQIRQNIEATQTAAFHQAQEQTWQLGIATAQDPELARIVATLAERGRAELSPDEQVRLEGALSPFYFGIESLLKLHEKGLIDSENWQNVFENNLHWFSNPHILGYIRSRPGPVSKRLVALIEGRIGEHTAQQAAEAAGRTARRNRSSV
jgi:hypothetical protein